MGALLVGIAPASLFWIAAAGFALSGFMNPLTNGPLNAVLQARVAPEMQGRVFSLVNSTAMAMMPLGTLAAAPVAEWIGIQAWFIAAGLVTAGMGVLGFTLPVLINIERDRALHAVEAAPLQPAVEQSSS